MSQPGFFDLSRRYETLDAKPDPLAALNKLISWETFRRRFMATAHTLGRDKDKEAF